MSTASPGFLDLALAGAILLSVVRGRTWRQLVLVAMSAVFFVSFQWRTSSLVALALFLIGGWAVLAWARRQPSRAVLIIGIAWSVLFLVVVKKYFGLDAWLGKGHFLEKVDIIGISYMVFKFIHVLVDEVQGQIPRLSLPGYLNYQLCLFTLTAGPINRYNDFQSFWEAGAPCELSSLQVFQLAGRLFTGIVKLGLVAPVFDWLIDRAGDPHLLGLSTGYWKFFAHFYLFPMELYFNFSGYTDIAIAAAGLMGLRLPENFNRPFTARNLIDFWDRWHMSLTQWLRDYVFMTSYRQAALHARKYSKVIGYLLLGGTILLAGIWHGPEAKYAVFGLIEGAGIILARAWGDLVTVVVGRQGAIRYLRSAGVRAAARIVTFHYTCIALLFFALGTDGTSLLWRVAVTGTRTALASGAVTGWQVALGASVPAAASGLLLLHAAWPAATSPASVGRAWGSMAIRAAAVAAIFLVNMAMAIQDPVVIYQKF